MLTRAGQGLSLQVRLLSGYYIREIHRSITAAFADDGAERSGRKLSLKLLRSLLITVGIYKGCLH